MRSLVLFCFVAGSAAAQDDGAFVDFQALKPEIAERMAIAARDACRSAGYQVGVTVVDRGGVPQVFVSDRYAGLHVYETSRRKAWTSVSFRMSTADLAAATGPGGDAAGIRQLRDALPLGGGLPVTAAGSLVAGIGVSGAPSPAADAECAEAGIDAILDEIAF